MKKFLMILASVLILFGINACNSCSNEPKEESTVSGTPATVENLISLDRQNMYLKYAEDYRWYETGIQLKDFLDEENDGTIERVVNVFQTIESIDSTSFDTFVIKFQHINGETIEDEIHGFWIEDWPLNEEEINVTFAEAYEKVMEVNLPKPHTRQVVLRKEVGPNECNPQWIFGNLRSQIYVDAVTGEVSDKSPAFNGLNVGTPLGEWP
jgi:hypothetical protein